MSSELKQRPLSLRSFNSAGLNRLTIGERVLDKFGEGRGGKVDGPLVLFTSKKLVVLCWALDLASNNLVKPTASVKEVGFEACTSVRICSLSPWTKPPTCWIMDSRPTLVSNLSYWLWYSQTELVWRSLVKSPKKSSNCVWSIPNMEFFLHVFSRQIFFAFPKKLVP